MNNEKETSRVEAFSDGVFAIAITLLILEIKVPRLEISMTNNPQNSECLLVLLSGLFDRFYPYLLLCYCRSDSLYFILDILDRTRL